MTAPLTWTALGLSLCVLMGASELRDDGLELSRGGRDEAAPSAEPTDEELESWGICRETFLDAEDRHIAECESEFANNSSVSYQEWRRYHGLKFRASPRVGRPVRHSARSGRTPRRARASRRTRSASRATGDPDPAPTQPPARLGGVP
jgi:hypothetical protein